MAAPKMAAPNMTATSPYHSQDGCPQHSRHVLPHNTAAIVPTRPPSSPPNMAAIFPPSPPRWPLSRRPPHSLLPTQDGRPLSPSKMAARRHPARCPQVTRRFELYACLSPLLPKAAAIAALTRLLRWLRKEDEWLFARCPPPFAAAAAPEGGEG